MRDRAPFAAPTPTTSPVAVRRWLLLLVVLAPGVFVAAACGTRFLVERGQASIALELSIVIVFATLLSLVAAGAIVRHFNHWRIPIRMLTQKIEEIRDNAALIDDLAAIRGAAAPVAELVQGLFREIKQQHAQIARLDGEMRQRVAQRTDALERELGAARNQANKDPLTGLHNRRMLTQCLQTLFDRANDRAFALTVLMADLDNFKLLNDTLGHPAGDEFLRSVGQIIRSTIRPNDFAFRCGGDEFVIVLGETGSDAGAQFAQRLASLVDSIGKTLRISKPVGMSIGMASISELTRHSVDALMAEADQRLYAVKKARRVVQGNAAHLCIK